MIHDNKKIYVTVKNLFLRKNQLYEMVLSNFFFVNQSITLNPKNEKTLESIVIAAQLRINYYQKKVKNIE